MAQFVYGKNVVKQMLMDNSKIKQIYMSVDDRDVEQLARKQRVQLKRVDKKTLTQMTKTDRHQGVVAEVDPYRLYSVDEIVQSVSEDGKGLIIMLDELEDPHNLGAILRTADAIGATGVIFKKTNAVGLTPTVAKVSAGAIDTVKCASVTNLSRTLEDLQKKGWWAVGTDMDGQDYRSVKYDFNTVLIIGNEGKGISRLLREKCDFVVSLPMRGKIESLNAAVSAGILMYSIYNMRFPLQGECCMEKDNPSELLYMCRMGDAHAQYRLFAQYEGLLTSLVNQTIQVYPPVKNYKDDLLQEARLGLLVAIHCYREDNQASFKTFLCIIAKRRVWNVLRQLSTIGRNEGTDVLALDAMMNEDETFYDIVEQQNKMFNPEYYYQYVDAFKQMTQGIMSLSHREVDVMRSWYDGDCYEEAARNQNCTVKAYDGRLQRVRAKIKDYIYHNQ